MKCDLAMPAHAFEGVECEFENLENSMCLFLMFFVLAVEKQVLQFYDSNGFVKIVDVLRSHCCQ